MRSALLVLFLSSLSPAQRPNPLARGEAAIPPEPTSPPPREVKDTRDQLSFHLPAGWNFSRSDGELSTFALDARSAEARTQFHAVANTDFNPFPYSTFSGALFYVSATPASSPQGCANQANAPAAHPATVVTIDGLAFRHGYAEHGGSCIESRDEVYTTLREKSCLRFDLVINTFCGGEVSGARDMTPKELDAVRQRLEGVLHSVHFTSGSSLHSAADR